MRPLRATSGFRAPRVSVRRVPAGSRGAARVGVGPFRPVDGAMELGTGYEWCDADDITEKQQAGQLAGAAASSREQLCPYGIRRGRFDANQN